ncbi:uncharacterized protein EMH_0022520 [Eimeria mitis]|uniref:Uncharacterized protein n=1 Tax=Eimeria mitis TaxID=44415 RepID=U6KA35_9EIME|nr:uncharacterized protein EMH_0022520 [Eimeria mitis]CDJ34865.1 hypothetical protein EMH_0022520 [Eimeria mitis]
MNCEPENIVYRAYTFFHSTLEGAGTAQSELPPEDPIELLLGAQQALWLVFNPSLLTGVLPVAMTVEETADSQEGVQRQYDEPWRYLRSANMPHAAKTVAMEHVSERCLIMATALLV